MTTRKAGSAGRSGGCLRLGLATLAACMLSWGSEAAAHVRVPDLGHLLRQKEAGRQRSLRAPVEDSAAHGAGARIAEQACRRREGNGMLAAFAGFAASPLPDASLAFVAVKLVDISGTGDPSSNTASLRHILSLLDDLNVPHDVVEVAQGTLRDGVACPLYVSIGDGDRKQTFWRFAPQDQPEGWFGETGRRLGGAPLAQPRPGARISSTFGPRRYYGRLTGGGFHDGIDFEARIGQPVYAAADGVIEHEGWYFQYGLTVKIRHAPQFTTLYAHLSRFAPGLPLGSSVHKGQLIGYIGMTGRSTGAHLHFSTIVNGRFVNPGSYLSDKRQLFLSGPALAAFHAWQKQVEAALAASRREHRPRRELDWTTRT